MEIYLAFSIGPIYSTIRRARRTRELWAASYMFSYLMNKLIDGLNPLGEILIPQGPASTRSKLGVGLFPDTVILKASMGVSLSDAIVIVRSVKKEFIDKIISDIRKKVSLDITTTTTLVKGITDADLEDYLASYFRIVGIQAGVDDLLELARLRVTSEEPLGEIKAIVSGSNILLSQLELRPSLAHLDPDPIRAFLSLANQSFLKDDAMSTRMVRFPSLYEIATQELRHVDSSSNWRYNEATDDDFDVLIQSKLKVNQGSLKAGDEIDLYNRLGKKGFIDHLSEYHRYVAYIHADGDGIGEVINRMRSIRELIDLSKRLTEFGVTTSMKLSGNRFSGNGLDDQGWGAIPIFIGGDDLLALSPIVSRTLNEPPSTVFALIDIIDKIFAETVASDLEPAPTLSFGVCIAYVKHPMREANGIAHDLLDSVKGERYKNRNRLHIQFIKHSGSSFKAVYFKGASCTPINPSSTAIETDQSSHQRSQSVWERTLDLVKNYGDPRYALEDGKATSPFLNSIIAEVREQRNLLRLICNDITKVQAWFDNNFDEPYHHGYKDSFFRELAEYLIEGYHQAVFIAKRELKGDVNQAFDEFLDCFYMTLRLIQFIRGHDEP